MENPLLSPSPHGNKKEERSPGHFRPRFNQYRYSTPLITPLRENWVANCCPNMDEGPATRNEKLTMTKRRVSVGASTPGRHIPRRKSLDVDCAHFKLKAVDLSSEDDDEDDVFDSSKELYLKQKFENSRKIRRRMACLSQGASEQKIFKFSAADLGRNTIKRRLSSTDKEVLQPDMTYRRTDRVLPRNPDRILDLPNFEDNFFTHVMAWWTDFFIIAALDNSLFACYVDGRGADSLNELKNNARYASVAVKNNILACGTTKGALELWDLPTKKNLAVLQHPHTDIKSVIWPLRECRVGCIDWKPDSLDILASGCRNGQIDFWDKRVISKGPVSTKQFAHTMGTICNVKYNNKGRYLASGDSGNMLKIWDINNMIKPVFEKIAHTSSVRAMAWHPNESYILATGGGVDDGYIKTWNVMRHMHPISELYVKGQVCSLVWNPLTFELISSQYLRGRNSTFNNQILVWNFPQMRKIGNLLGHTGRVLHLQFSPCRTCLASSAGDETLRIWKINKSKVRKIGWPTSELSYTGLGCIR